MLRTSKCIKQKLIDLKGEIDNSTITATMNNVNQTYAISYTPLHDNGKNESYKKRILSTDLLVCQ